MPQGPLAVNTYALNPSKVAVPLQTDASKNLLVGVSGAAFGPGSNLLVSGGGASSTLNVTAAAVIKATPGRLVKILVIAPGSAGNLVINDLASTSGSAAANTILSLAFGSMTAGQVVVLDWPCAVGIAVTAVPSAGSPIFSISWS